MAQRPVKNPVFITASEVGQYCFCPVAWHRERQGAIPSREEALVRMGILRAKKFLSPEEKAELQALLDLLEAYDLLEEGLRHHARVSRKTALLGYLQLLIWISTITGLILLTVLFWRIL